MKKLVLTFGTIAGLLMIVWFGVFYFSLRNNSFSWTAMEIGGYATMIIAFSVIFFAVKAYRDKHNDGKITFWKGFLIGLYISLVASFIYAASWTISYPMFTEFKDVFMKHYKEQLEKKKLCLISRTHEDFTQLVKDIYRYRTYS